jgi:hypothetical protein
MMVELVSTGSNSYHPSREMLSDKVVVYTLAVILLGISLIPFVFVDIPPLQDYPNHLARMHILVHGHTSDLVREFYEVQWALVPYLAMDAIVPLLTKVMPLEAAGKVFLALTFALLISGTIALHYALHHRISPWPLLVFLFLYNRLFLMGVVNYVFGIGLALWVLAAWIMLRRKQAMLVIPLFSGLTALVYLSHLFALAFYVLAVFAYEFGQAREDRASGVMPVMSWLKSLAPFAVSGILVLLSPTSHSGLGIEFGSFERKAAALAGTIRTYNDILDALAAILIVGLFIVARTSKALAIAKTMYWPIAIVTTAAILMPNMGFNGDTSITDMRLPLPLVLLIIASTELRRTASRLLAIVALGLFVVFGLRTASTTLAWQEAERQHAEYGEAISHLPAGAKLFVAHIAEPLWPGQNFHVPCGLAVIKKAALCSSVFTFPTYQMTIRFSEWYRYFNMNNHDLVDAAYGTSWDRVKEEWDSIRDRYEFMLVARQQFVPQSIALDLIRNFSGTNVALYRIKNSELADDLMSYRRL